MTFDPDTKEIAINRGSRGTIKLTNSEGKFKVGDKIKFSIVERRHYENVVFQKEYIVTEESSVFYLTLTSEDTKIGDFINREKKYWYEIEYNNEVTLIGHDKDGEKEFILYPEAGEKNGGDN